MNTNNDCRYSLEGLNGFLQFEYVPCVNYSMQVNRCDTVIKCVLVNAANKRVQTSSLDLPSGSSEGAVNESPEEWQDVTVGICGEMVTEKKIHIDTVKAGSEFDVTGSLALSVDAASLINLTEGRETSFTITVKEKDAELLKRDFPLQMMAYDQWTGSVIRPDLLASFVTPNQPMLSRVAVNAARFMEKWTGSGAMDEYQSQDPNRVRQQVAAVYEALRGESLVYATPPASFEAFGQRVRLADKVLTEKLGTCVDLSVLMASCLESIGINPILILTKGHCFVGAWLVQDCYNKPVGDDAAFLLKSAADGINEIVAVETTCLTSSAAVGFDEAVASAMKKLHDEANFDLFVDVYRARVNGIRPLPVRVAKDGQWIVENEGIEHANATTDVKQYDRYDLSAYTTEGTKVTKLQLWERKLLDFSLRNNLLNMRLGKKIIPMVSFSIDKLEDYLQAGQNFQVLPFPLNEKPQPKAGGIFDSSQYAQLEDFVKKELTAKKIHSFQSETELKDALKYVYRTSRTAIEENGANNLYLVLGLLQWFETDRSVQPRYAPVLLLPIEIVRSGGLAGYVIRTRDEEIVLNITLTELLKQQHGIDLSVLNTLPLDESGVDVKKIFAIIRDKIKDKKGWNVLDESVIGLFSFNKFVMWNDIHSNAERLKEHKVISSLIENRSKLADEVADVDAKDVDCNQKPAEFTIPVDVDSSQLEAIIASGEGKSFILHGPPGTGKSQTITNIIANALYQGKRVLFVAEKMAALSVVQSRLEKIGLAPFCLELHSNKVTKQHFLKQMEDALNVAHTRPSADFQKESEELFAKRQELIRYIEALHKKQAGGLSLYDCITGYLSLAGEELDVGTANISSLNKEHIQKLAEKVADLDTIFKICGHPSKSALQELDITDGSASGEARFSQSLKDFLDGWKAWETSSKNSHLDDKRLEEIREAVKTEKDNAAIKQSLASQFNEMVLDLNFDEINAQWTAIQQKWFLPRYFAKKNYVKTLVRYGVKSAADVETIVDGLFKTRHYEKKLAAISFPFSEKMLADGEKVTAALKALRSVANIDASLTPQEIKATIEKWYAHKQEFRNWYLWNDKQRELRKEGFDCAVQYILCGHSGAETADALLKAIYNAMAKQMIGNDDQLRFFNGLLFNETIAKYRALTARFQELSKQELYCRLAAKVPSSTTDFADSSEPGILKRNIKNGGRGTSIRKIIDQIPTLLPRLCPCMLMSPISVAQYIDLANEKFDLVIFDEASQMPTSEAVGAIARGKALVCVGDPKQMPPTSFFSTQQVDDEEADIDDMESILDDCISLSMPSKYLTWHYRSKHESLIAFSNSQYYDGRLFTFPSVDDQVSKVTLHRINGTYDKGKTRCNRAEAEAIVKEVIRRLQEATVAGSSAASRSIGIVSFSKVQQNLIEDMLCDELAKHPKLEALAFESAEPIFIKNLENVQGDERDVILFSIGYGPDANGKVSMNFGPLNNAGGERRLNVAVSRARYEMVVYSTLSSDQIDLRRTQALGVAGLKKFLEFAEKGRIPVSASASDMTDSVVVKDIAGELQKRGYKVNMNVGRSQFKVDIAVVDPQQPDRYLLGILCDGANYYATKTVRDREVVQPSVLKMLNWNIMHVWTLDWYERRQAVIDSIIETIEKRKVAEPKTETVAIEKAEIIEETPLPATSLPVMEKREIQEIPLSEIENTIRLIIEQQMAMEKEDLMRLTARQLGFSHRGARIDNAIEQAMTNLLRTNLINANGTKISQIFHD